MKEIKSSQRVNSAHNFTFWFHLFITTLAWVGPILFSWYLMVAAYGMVVLQFILFKKCLLNAEHKLDTSGDTTFYSYLLETAGIQVNRKSLKNFVRNYLYILLAAITMIWQLVLSFDPLLF